MMAIGFEVANELENTIGISLPAIEVVADINPNTKMFIGRVHKIGECFLRSILTNVALKSAHSHSMYSYAYYKVFT